MLIGASGTAFFYHAALLTVCVLQFVRSGRVAITTSCFERVNEFLADREARHQAEMEIRNEC